MPSTKPSAVELILPSVYHTSPAQTGNTAHNQLPTVRTEAEFLAAFDSHVTNLCQEMGQTSDVLALKRLRAEVIETQRRKETARSLFADCRKREQKLMATFFLYKKGMPIERQATLDVAAEMAGLNSRTLCYEQFRELMLDTERLKLAEQVVQEMQAHERKQRVVQINRQRSQIEARIGEARSRFARRAW